MGQPRNVTVKSVTARLFYNLNCDTVSTVKAG